MQLHVIFNPSYYNHHPNHNHHPYIIITIIDYYRVCQRPSQSWHYPTSTPGSMLMEVICLTVSEGECRSITRLWILQKYIYLYRIPAFRIHLILTWIRILGSTFGKSGSGSSDPPFRNSGSRTGSSDPHLEKVDPDPRTYFSYRTNYNAYFCYRQNLEKAFLR